MARFDCCIASEHCRYRTRMTRMFLFRPSLNWKSIYFVLFQSYDCDERIDQRILGTWSTNKSNYSSNAFFFLIVLVSNWLTPFFEVIGFMVDWRDVVCVDASWSLAIRSSLNKDNDSFRIFVYDKPKRNLKVEFTVAYDASASFITRRRNIANLRSIQAKQ